MLKPDIPRQNKPSMLEYALRYLKRGWSVIPLHSIKNGRCTCGRKDCSNAGKHPRIDKWKKYQTLRATEEEIRRWWTRWPDAGIAVLTGKLSGVVVIDVEDIDKGYSAAGTLTAITGGGGKHYYFKHPGVPVPCAVRFLPETDCRGDGGYVVAPPSLHRSGRRYRWEDPKKEIADAPVQLLAMLRGQRSRLEAKDWEKDVVHGERDEELTRRAGRLLQTGMSEAECLLVLLTINTAHCKPPLEDEQVRKIVHSIAGREATKRKDTTARFTVSTQREMLRKYGEDETKWLVSEWLPEASCGLIVAPPGNYKTWILTALGFSVATGRPFLGRYPVMGKGPVLFIQQEDPWWMLESRLSRMFEQLEPTSSGDKNPTYMLDCRFTKELDDVPIYWYTDRRLNFANKAMLTEMERKIAELKPQLVMIDPLYTAVDTRDYMAEGAQKMIALKLIRDTYNCSFVIAHHTTVSGSDSEGRASIWGSQFLNAWLEFGWRMPEGTDSGNIVIRHFKSCEDPKRIRVKFKITDYSFDVNVDDDYARSVSERIEEIILGGGDVKSVRDIAEEAKCSKSAVQRVLRKLDIEKSEEE